MADTDMLAELFDDISVRNGGTLPAEVTLECNPVNVSREKLNTWKDMGITRLSLGVQSFRDKFLERAGRRSSRKVILSALDLIKMNGAFDLNIDLIQGLPGMATNDQIRDLKEALSFNPDHISWYGLILEEGTVLSDNWDERCTGAEDDGDAAWDSGRQLLEQNGYRHYEISNFCLPGKESRHNSMYWEMRPYLGCGPSAVSMMPGSGGLPLRFRTKEDIETFSSGHFVYRENEELLPADFLKDFLLMGLRLADGIDLKRFVRIFGRKAEDLFPRSLTLRCESGHLVLDEAVLRASSAGMDLLNTILVEIFCELDEMDLSDLSCRFLS